MIKILAILLAVFLPCLALAQVDSPTKAEQLAEMKKLAFMPGTWEGTSKTRMGPGPASESFVREEIESVLGGLGILIRGRGTAKGADGSERLTHEAVGIFNWDPANKRYRFVTQTEKGYFTVADAAFQENGDFVWSLRRGGDAATRYTIRLDEAGRWTERGENTQDGKTWAPFFEMVLSRVK
jgi:hypothetical protein